MKYVLWRQKVGKQCIRDFFPGSFKGSRICGRGAGTFSLYYISKAKCTVMAIQMLKMASSEVILVAKMKT